MLIESSGRPSNTVNNIYLPNTIRRRMARFPCTSDFPKYVVIFCLFVTVACAAGLRNPEKFGSGKWGSAEGMPDGLKVGAQYMEDHQHPPKADKTKDNNGLPFYSEASQILGQPKLKKLVEDAPKIFPNYRLEPNRNIEAPGSRTGFSTHLSQFSLDPKVFGMRNARAKGLVPDVAFRPNPDLYSPVEKLGGPNILYGAGLYEDKHQKAEKDAADMGKMLSMFTSKNFGGRKS